MVGSLVAVVALGAPATMARADQAGTVREQVAGVQAEVAATGARLHDLTVAYDQANLRAANLAQQVQGDEAQLHQLQVRVAGTQATLRRAAVLSYTGSQTEPATVGPSSVDPSVRAEYLQVAAGDLTDVADRYRAEQAALERAARDLRSEQVAAQGAAAAVARARDQALADARAEQAQLDRLQAQLDQLVAADRSAASRQGMPVNNGLVDVVRRIVAPTTTDPTTTDPTTTAPPAPAPTAAPTTPAPAAAPAGGVWLQLRECESGDNYRANTGNGFYGAYQFSEATWSGLGYPGRPDLEPPALQDQAAQALQARSGWGQWPACAAALGLL